MGLPGQFDVKLPLTRRKRAVAKRAQYTRLLAIIKKLEKKR